jgi:lysine 6-dehydrogenase
MRVVVLGGAGGMGRVCVKDLVASRVEEVVVADLDGAAAEESAGDAAPLDPGRDVNLSSSTVDAGDPQSLQAVLEGADVVANCVNYALNPQVMRAAARSDTHYIDLGGLFHGTKRQLDLAPEIEGSGILCLLGMGSTPGTMNVMAAHGVAGLDEVTDIFLRCGGDDPEPTRSPLPAPYAIDTIIDEFTMPAIALRGGELREMPPASEDEAFLFPEPVGRQTAVLTLHSELATMPSTFAERGLQTLDFKVAFGEDVIARYRAVAAVGLGGTEPIALPEGGAVVPRSVVKALAGPQQFSGKDVESLVVVLRGKRAGADVELRIEELSPPNNIYGVGGADANTGIPPSVAAQMIARGDIAASGVKAPEEAVPPEPLFKELEARGIEVSVRDSTAEETGRRGNGRGEP